MSNGGEQGPANKWGVAKPKLKKNHRSPKQLEKGKGEIEGLSNRGLVSKNTQKRKKTEFDGEGLKNSDQQVKLNIQKGKNLFRNSDQRGESAHHRNCREYSNRGMDGSSMFTKGSQRETKIRGGKEIERNRHPSGRYYKATTGEPLGARQSTDF